jgi:hypothetical protein
MDEVLVSNKDGDYHNPKTTDRKNAMDTGLLVGH